MDVIVTLLTHYGVTQSNQLHELGESEINRLFNEVEKLRETGTSELNSKLKAKHF